jgi:hypothetical protein
VALVVAGRQQAVAAQTTTFVAGGATTAFETDTATLDANGDGGALDVAGSLATSAATGPGQNEYLLITSSSVGQWTQIASPLTQNYDTIYTTGGSTIVISGNGNSIQLFGNGDTATINGVSDSVTANGAGTVVYLNQSGDSASVVGGTDYVAAGRSDSVSGQNETIVAGVGSIVTLSGTGADGFRQRRRRLSRPRRDRHRRWQCRDDGRSRQQRRVDGQRACRVGRLRELGQHGGRQRRHHFGERVV